MEMVEKIENYIFEIQKASDDYWKANNYNQSMKPSFNYTKGQKYFKIWCVTNVSTSIHCFVDNEGNIYKPASYKIPASGVRGHIDRPIKPLLGRDFYRR